MRVLVVDDEAELVSALAERLNMRGIETEYVTHGKEALQRVRQQSFDLAVLDMKMPGLAGLELKERLRSLSPDLKYIFVTGYGSDQILDDIRRDQETNVSLVKPVDIDDLIRAMRSVMTGGNQ